MSLPVREGPISQSAPIDNIAQMVAQGRFDCQLALVRAHWASVRRLWLTDSDLDPGAKSRSELPPEFWIGCGMPGIATIRPTDNGRFKFTEGGLTTVILPAYDCIPGNLDANPERHVEELRDLIAIDFDHPDRFWRRRGEALVLGHALLEISRQESEPVKVFRNPLTWLRSGGNGIVVLDWDYAWDLLLDRELIAEDVELGTRLEGVLKPSIWIEVAV